ncbi:MAG: hypothetical protein JO345_08150 [Streptosporangiaceae bacterium]|nr:hypothetical protein [Streptosporangiaceae bacterium]
MANQVDVTAPVTRSLSGPGIYMCGLTWGDGLLWHSDQAAGKIFAMDRAIGTVVREIDCPQARADLAYHDGLLYQVGGRPKRLLLIDPRTGALVGQQQVSPPSGRLCGTEAGPEGMWMCLRNPSVVQLRDFESMTVRREYPVPGGPSGLTYAPGFILYSQFEAGTIHAVDAATGRLLGGVRVAGHPTGLTWDGYEIWYCDFRARTINAIRLNDVLNGTCVTSAAS